MKLVGFRTPKPRKYSYKPVFYDPVKEIRENRNNALSNETGREDSEIRLRMRLRGNRKILDEHIRKRKRIMNIFLSLLLLLMLVYYIFF